MRRKEPASHQLQEPYVTARKVRWQSTSILSPLFEAAHRKACLPPGRHRDASLASGYPTDFSSRCSLGDEQNPMDTPADRGCSRRTVRRRPLRGVAGPSTRRPSSRSVRTGDRRRLDTPPQLAPGRSRLHAQTSQASRRRRVSPGSVRGEACSVHRHLFTLPGRTFLVPGVNLPLLYRPPCSQATESTRVRDDSAVTGRWACDLHTPSRHFFLFSYRSTGYSSASVAHPIYVSLHVCVLHCPCTASTQIMRTTSSPGCLRHDCCDAAWPTEPAPPSAAPRSVPPD